jgi:NAD(P)-dependent dehydrogenase (short-subunit alcohol dehydrogenase family)
MQDAVVVITGASSGIERSAARMFAARGSTVVLSIPPRRSCGRRHST